MEVKANEFSNGDIVVTYDPCKCTLSGICAKELSEVFSDSIIPWVNLDNTDTDRIVEQIERCPSGALKYFLKQKDVA
ncbi:(4Fe-4S)-binding protein [Seonamhaeicola marinus]|uniref:(4Fe-4S)-binding protein n=1 Tax=Seonamhaeicola marinus TaxID=1912246 RepID=A0A5D0IYS8_9FLAO|nr:(4Fe-4S)-binding protein [Seonamhaeicola marinus]TYA86752.1 (4Fe-4S)-binding protein [Seonamhaeicola marinus]